MNWIKQLLGGRKVSAQVVVEHVELTSTHLVLGLQLGWANRTEKSIPIKDVQLKLYLHGHSGAALGLYPLERFSRTTGHKALNKMAVRPFTLPPGEAYVEQIRFISEEVRDLPVGRYTIEVSVVDTHDNRYSNQDTIHIKSQHKYRLDEEWQLDG